VKVVRPADVLNDPELSAPKLRAEIDRIVADVMEVLIRYR
jgi:hypothetical protein